MKLQNKYEIEQDGKTLIYIGRFVGEDFENLLKEAKSKGLDEEFYTRPIFENDFYVEPDVFEKFNNQS